MIVQWMIQRLRSDGLIPPMPVDAFIVMAYVFLSRQISALRLWRCTPAALAA